MSMTILAESSRARRLKTATRSAHDDVDRSIVTAAAFTDRQGYGRFLRIQYLFHRDVEVLYADTRLRAALPDLIARCRLPLVIEDMDDLAIALPGTTTPMFTMSAPANFGSALGWLYVAEGSNMGAALLRKEAAKLSLSDSFGARHLAPANEGPAAHWRAFTAALDAVSLSEAEETQAEQGALAAFARVRSHIDACRA